MNKVTIAKGVAVAGTVALASTAANAATQMNQPVGMQDASSVKVSTARLASPGDVKAAMESLGMSELDTPITSLMSGESRIAADSQVQMQYCNRNYCVWVRPAVHQQNTAAFEAEGLIGRLEGDRATTLAGLLEKIDGLIPADQEWSIALGENGEAVIS